MVCLSIVAVIASAVTTIAVAQAADLNPAHLPVDTEWVVHINQEALSELEVMEEIRDLYPQITNDIREWFENRYGIDPQDGLR